MKKSLPFLLFLCTLFCTLQAQEAAPSASPLAGTYLIGSNQTGTNTFKTITAAVSEINNSGVSGPVVFLLTDASYNNATGEIFPIKINQFQGTSTVNTLTIKPNSGNNNVTITGTNINGYTALPAVFQIDGGDNIIIDGSNTANGSSRDLTVVNNDNVSYAARTAVWISSNASNGATNIKVLNLKLQMNNRNQDALQLSGVFSGSNGREGTNGLSGTTASAANSNVTIRNNEFLKVRQGIIVNGNTTPALQTSTVEFSFNKLGSTVDSEKPARAIFFSSVNNFNISDNSIIGVLKNDFSSSFAGIEIENGSNYTIKRNILQDFKLTNNSTVGNGIWIKGISPNGVISENKISNIKNTGGGIIRAVTIEMDQNISSGLMIANNFISDVASNGTTTNTGHGIYVVSGKDIKVYHNTVAMNASQTGQSAAIYFAGGTGFDIRNNIFTNTSSTGVRYAIYSAVSTAAFTADYNDYFSTPLGFLGGDKTDLPAWRAATGKDGASKNINPVFVSPSDLHLQTIAANNGLANAGANLLTAVPTDIDGQSRTATPEIGADEFAFVVTLATEPTAQASQLNFTNVTANSFRINWTNGNGANRIVVMRTGSAVDSPPVDATAYTANSTFGSGSSIGTGNFVVYNGSANSVDVTGLSPATTYYVSVYEYNGTGSTANYLTTAPPTGSQKTLNANLGWQISTINTLNTITFDSTVSGVNNGPFASAGFSPAPTAGQLDSNSWSLNGFEDGAIPFGGINTNPDFGRGISLGGVSSGGVYSFKTSANNAALGIQPSATDFVPGNVSLRFQNQTGSPITSLSIGFKVYIYNDQATSSNFNFSHSADNASFTDISEINIVSPAQADASPSWKASYRVVTITGLNIPANGFYYLKWSGTAITTGSAYDEFALDDIVLSANPVSTFASFEGTAENFSVHGNASLSGNMTVNGDLKFTSGKLSILDKTLMLGGAVINTITGGLKGSATSNISITGNGNKTLSFDQTIPGVSNMLNNFTIPFAAGSQNIVDLANSLVINGNLNVGLEQTLNLSTTALTGSLNSITINGALRTQNTSTLPFPAGKIFGGTGTVIFDAAVAQTLVSGTYNNITVSNPAGVTAAGNVIANGTVDLPMPNANDTKGSLDMSTFTLILGDNATNTGNGDVTGIVRRNTILPNVQYTFGHPNTSILFPSVGTLPTSLGLKTQIGTAPTWKPEAVKRVYDFIQTGAAGTKAIIKAHYLDAELNGNTENKLVDWAHIFGTPGQTLEQGRSNFNVDENWITLTNADISRYFTSEFGKVNLTFADSKAAFLTWNGNISNSWNTVGNWTAPDGTRNDTPNRGTVIFIPNEADTPNDPLITGGQEVLSITIQEGGIVNTVENIITPPLFTVYGGAGAWINNGTFNAGNSTVIFNNLDATIAGKTDFNNVSITTGAGLRPLTDNVMKIKGVLSVQGVFTAGALENTVEYTGSNQAIVIPGGLAAAYHHLTISGTGAVFPTTLKVNGNLTVNKPVDFDNKTIVMSGLNLQVIEGFNAAFYNVDINNTGAGVKLGANTAVSGTLSLTNGVLAIGNFNLTLGQNPVAGSPFNVNKMIVADGAGFVRKPYAVAGTYLFPIGERTSNPSYSPITVDITAGSFNQAFIDVSVVDAIHPNNYSLQNYISRYWNVKPEGITNATVTINASYINAENLFPQTSMAAGQLDGPFDIQANPWKKVGTLAGTTLTATNVSLTNGQTSVFTGIKGGEFTATVNGNAVYCENETINLTSTVTGGDAPYLYLWSNSLGTESTATAPSIAGTPTYTLTITDANGLKTTAGKSIVINAAPVAGTLSTASTIACFSFAPDDIILSGSSGSVLYWERSDEISFSNPIKINNTSTTLPGSQAGEIIGVTYFRAAVSNLLCGPVFTEPIKIETKTTVWSGNAWSLGAPDLKTAAVLRSTYPFTESLSACSLLITNNASITVPAEKDVLLYGALIVDTGSSLTFKSNTNLVQVANESNFGEVKVERESSKLFRLDYTMWGSPVAPSQTLKNFSPKTLSNRFYDYNSENDLFRVIPDPSTTVFKPGKGYLIRMPDNHIAYGSAMLPLSWTGTFTGIPTTGNVSIALEGSTTTGDYTSSGFNMISNPYASLVDANKFLTDNGTEIDGTLYFWRRRNNVPDASAYYATYTLAGGVASASSEIPNGFIPVGQGFIVKKATTGSVTGKALFTNAMRTAANNENQFFKNSTPEKRDRIWLNVSNTAGEFGQTLLAYMDIANNEVDRTDGKYLADGSTALTSWLNDTRYIIQGRAPFNSSDIVPLHFETATGGLYTIAIDHVDGLFEGSQMIYLRDRFQGITHNLKNASYTFETDAGKFSNRFEIVYNDHVLSAGTVSLEQNSVALYKKDDHLFVRSKVNLDQIEVYDMNGRLLATVKNIKGKEASIRMGKTNQMLILKITSTEGETIGKKFTY